jgi:hypothetical protein
MNGTMAAMRLHERSLPLQIPVDKFMKTAIPVIPKRNGDQQMIMYPSPRIAPIAPDKALIAARDAMSRRAVDVRNARLSYENMNPRSVASRLAFKKLCNEERAYEEAVENLAAVTSC